ncbi:XRE family transcriptional regulator [Lachnospiraceae bacterium OttesenSCG-928-E19]|nr:XRE family transcriptional regulator [Lachnospiraceae bacterium OttesenSCG-928-E19]
MKNKPTDQLMDALTKVSSVENYIASEQEHLIDDSLSEYLNQILKNKNLKKSYVIQKAEFNEIYGYQIFSGTRTPSRDKLISLAFGMQLSLEETQQLLKYAGFAALYPKSPRDSIIIWSVSRTLTICEANELLYNQSLPTL